MTTIRRYIFAFVAVCAAFAIGIALGNGPLQGDSTTSSSASISRQNALLNQTVADLRREQTFSQAVSAAAGSSLLQGQLTNVSVAVFVLPGVPASTVAGVVKSVNLAGGEVSVLAHLSPTVVDPGKKTYVDSVANNSIKGLEDLSSAASYATYARLGALLARAYTGPSDAVAVNNESRKIDAQLQGAKLVTLSKPLQRRGSGVIVLGNGQRGSADSIFATHQIEVQLVDSLASVADGVLVAAPGGASESGGLISQVAGSSLLTHAVATLNVVDSSAGQVASAAALAAAISGEPRAYGMRGDTVALPSTLTPAG